MPSAASAAAADLEPARPSGERLPRAARIRNGREIRQILRDGERLTGRLVTLRFAPSRSARPRFAVVVPRHGRRIVARNLVRRRLREIVRREALPAVFAAKAATDFVLVAKPAAYRASYDRLRDSVVDAVRRACVS